MNILKKIINHKFFFWFVTVLAIFNLVLYILDKSYSCVVVFTAASILTINFIKHIPLALFITILVSNVVFGCKKVKEGLDEKKEKIKNLDNKKAEISDLLQQFQSVKDNKETGINSDSFSKLMNLNKKIDVNNIKDSKGIENAIKHLRDNKEMLKNIIDKF